MKLHTLKIWSLVTITPVFVAIIIRMVWELAVNYSAGGLVMSTLVVIGLLGLYILLLYLLLKPNLKMLTHRYLWLGIAVMATAAFIGGIIHLTRFIPSPQSGLPWSPVIALLYLFAALNAYGILIWFVWSLWKREDQKE
jgi:hypothetical protein